MVNFSYDGEKLSDYGCIVASIRTAYQDSVQIGTNITYNTIQNQATYMHKIINSKYDDVITATFDICRNPCLYNGQNMGFSDGEISHFMRWLKEKFSYEDDFNNQKQYKKFKPIYKDGSYSDLYFYGTFTSISAIVFNGKVVGFTLTFTSNSPFGYVNDKEYTTSLNSAGGQFIFYDDSDEIGYLYPYFFQVECLSDGTLTIQNDRDKKSTIITGCLHGEVITMDCGNKVIHSSISHTTLYNDFNYNYPRLINDKESRRNIFTVSLPCNIIMKYAPIRKAGIIV